MPTAEVVIEYSEGHSMNRDTEERLDRIALAVLTTVRGRCCQECLITLVRQQAREERLRVSGRNVRTRVKALWAQGFDDAPRFVL